MLFNIDQIQKNRFDEVYQAASLKLTENKKDYQGNEEPVDATPKKRTWLIFKKEPITWANYREWSNCGHFF
ncbi:hypothetical protein MASR2M47_31980 [Draconibacterium sp.]